MKDETYDFEANKALIKLYLLFPADAKEELVALVRKTSYKAGLVLSVALTINYYG